MKKLEILSTTHETFISSPDVTFSWPPTFLYNHRARRILIIISTVKNKPETSNNFPELFPSKHHPLIRHANGPDSGLRTASGVHIIAAGPA